eukprot:jgi/Mesvir1/2128/Mv16654-RA.2
MALLQVALGCSFVAIIWSMWREYSNMVSTANEQTVSSSRQDFLSTSTRDVDIYFSGLKSTASMYNENVRASGWTWDPEVDETWLDTLRRLSWSLIQSNPLVSMRVATYTSTVALSYARIHIPVRDNPTDPSDLISRDRTFLDMGARPPGWDPALPFNMSYWEVSPKSTWQHCSSQVCTDLVNRYRPDHGYLANITIPQAALDALDPDTGCMFFSVRATTLECKAPGAEAPTPVGSGTCVHNEPGVSDSIKCVLPRPRGYYQVAGIGTPWAQALIAENREFLAMLTPEVPSYAGVASQELHVLYASAVAIAHYGKPPVPSVVTVSFALTALLDTLRTRGEEEGAEVFVVGGYRDGVVFTDSLKEIHTVLPGSPFNSSCNLIVASVQQILSVYGSFPKAVAALAGGVATGSNSVTFNSASYFLDCALVDVGLPLLVVVARPGFSAPAEHGTALFLALLLVLAALFALVLALPFVFLRSALRVRSKAKELAVAKELAEEKTTLMSSFVANEMAVPLAALASCVDLLLAPGVGSVSAMAEESKCMARASTASLQQLWSDIQNLRNLLGGNVALEASVVDLEETLESAVALARASKPSPYVDVCLDIAPHCPRYVLGDGHRIKQVLVTLLASSLSCTHRGRVVILLRCQRGEEGGAGDGGEGDARGVSPFPSNGDASSGASTSEAGDQPLAFFGLEGGPFTGVAARGADKGAGGALSAVNSSFSGAKPGRTVAHTLSRDVAPSGIFSDDPLAMVLVCDVDDTGALLHAPDSLFQSGRGGAHASSSGVSSAGARAAGLSFSIARSVARMMGGDVRVVPREGPGARIRFSMRLRMAEEPQRAWLRQLAPLTDAQVREGTSPAGGGTLQAWLGTDAGALAAPPGADMLAHSPSLSGGPAFKGGITVLPAVTERVLVDSSLHGDSSRRSRASDSPSRRVVNPSGDGCHGGGNTVLLALSEGMECQLAEKWFASQGLSVLKARSFREVEAMLAKFPTGALTGGHNNGAAHAGAEGGEGGEPVSTLHAGGSSDGRNGHQGAGWLSMVLVDSEFASVPAYGGYRKPQEGPAFGAAGGNYNAGAPDRYGRGSHDSLESSMRSHLVALLAQLPHATCVGWLLRGGTACRLALERCIGEGVRLAGQVAPATQTVAVDGGHHDGVMGAERAARMWGRHRMVVICQPLHTWRLESLLASAQRHAAALRWGLACNGDFLSEGADASTSGDGSSSGLLQRTFCAPACLLLDGLQHYGSHHESGEGGPPASPLALAVATYGGGVRSAAHIGVTGTVHGRAPAMDRLLRAVHLPPGDAMSREAPSDAVGPLVDVGEGVPAGPLSLRPTLINYEELQMLEKVGEGTFGEVFRGKWLGKEVAIKRMRTSSLTPSRLLDFDKEVAILEKIRHPNCVLYMGFCLRPQLCIITEFIAGGNLAARLAEWRRTERGRPLGLPLVLKVARDVCLGMMSLHCRRPAMMHRDLKSTNLLVDGQWNTKLADFGISRILEDSLLPMTQAIGSPGWMAPELFKGAKYDGKVDVYSYGIVLWELLSLSPPYAGMGLDHEPLALIYKVCMERLRPTRPRAAPDLLWALIEDCWADDPASRPGFTSVLQRLDAIEAQLLPPAPQLPYPAPVTMSDKVPVVVGERPPQCVADSSVMGWVGGPARDRWAASAVCIDNVL